MATKKLELLATAKVGEMITKIVKSAAQVGLDLHDTAVQCALHIREHGDTSLASRLCNELQSNVDQGLRSAAVINVQGLRYWFSMACPVVEDRKTKTWKLIEKENDGYTKYVERMLLKTASKEGDVSTAHPDETSGPGGRMFFVEWCAVHPFFADGDVKNSQRSAIRVMGLEGVLGLGYGIETRINKAKDDGLILPGALPLVEEYVAKVKALTVEFEKAHAVEMVGEKRALGEFKDAKERGESITAPSPAPTSTDTQTETTSTTDVGGDVAKDLVKEDSAITDNTQVEQPEVQTA